MNFTTTDSPSTDSPNGVPRTLSDVDQLVTGPWERPITWRQPVHTVYIPADRFEGPHTAQEWGDQCLRTIAELEIDLSAELGLSSRVAELAVAKLRREPIEDLRVDFEDGFTQRTLPAHQRDSDEDAKAEAAGAALATILGAPTEVPGAPPFAGARIKSFHPAVRHRGLRTLTILLTQIAHSPAAVARLSSDPRAFRLTLPKVQHHLQVAEFVTELSRLEASLKLPQLGFEVQIETPQAVVSPAGGALEPARILSAGAGRILSFHYGTYDYSASLGIDAAWQSMEHPVADFAKNILQILAAGSGVELSDGSTNRIPLGSREQHLEGWRHHLRLVQRHLRRGIRQGWDLHPHQLLSRHGATIGYFRADWEETAQRLSAYVAGDSSTWMDEPATAKAMAGYLSRAVACGALTTDELATVGVSDAQLYALRTTGRTQ